MERRVGKSFFIFEHEVWATLLRGKVWKDWIIDSFQNFRKRGGTLRNRGLFKIEDKVDVKPRDSD